MSRDDGFSVMDVSVDIVNDPKVRKLFRLAPDHAGVAFLAYMATMAESWRAGRRVTVDDAWPAFLPFDQAAVDALLAVGLLDARAMVTTNAWRGWFNPANERRQKSRDRWRRANDRRHADAAQSSTNDSAVTAPLPRGTNAVTASPVPPVPSVPTVGNRDTPPPPAKRGRRKDATNPRSTKSAPRQRGSNPRASGTSTRQVRADQKRGRTELASVLQEAARREPAEPEAAEADDETAWLYRKAKA